ncbi:MAG: NUDIX domain-containing protein [Candidatus Heimdallarchaeota archaeon]|nr:NUDIX domain-containing protein [Candidatus Heimdallarchaeota archaeon]
MKKVYVGMAAVIEKDEKFLILKRSKDRDFEPEAWETVTGRLEADESPVTGVLREVEEETSLKVEVILPLDTGFFYRGGKEFPMVFISYYCKYVEGNVNLTWEHSEYKWITLQEALDLPDLKHFHVMLQNLRNLKKSLPENFKYSFSPTIHL